MKPEGRSVPIFALDPAALWSDDLMNAIEASVQYQSEHGGKFGPMFAFAPMMEPENLDEWEPIEGRPENVLVVSIARHEDERLFRALARAELELAGPPMYAAVDIDFEQPIANLYERMAETDEAVRCVKTGDGPDDVTVICLRGTEAALAFDKALLEETR